MNFLIMVCSGLLPEAKEWHLLSKRNGQYSTIPKIME